MEDQSEQPTVHVVDLDEDTGSHDPRRLLALFVLAGVIAITAMVLGRIPDETAPGPPEPIDVVVRLEDAINRADPDDVRTLLAADSVLTWPAGPPWGGPLTGAVELVSEPATKQLLDHVAGLEAYLAFYAVVGGETSLGRCSVYSLEPELATHLADSWVVCSFSIASDLLDLLSGGSAAPFGQMRFRVNGATVSAVLVETWEERFSPIEFLSWVREERPAAFEQIFSGRVTLPNYSADAAAEILALATDYAATFEE